MKKYLFILTTLLFISCSTHKNTNAQHVSNKDQIVITYTNDTLKIAQDSIRFEFYTNNYKTEYEKIHTKENIGEIIRAIEYRIDLSSESLKMIEEDGGMTAVLKNILSKENFDRVDRRFTIIIDFIISLGDLTISEYKIRIYKDDISGGTLSTDEIKKLFAYCKQMRFIYTGTKFKNETVSAGYFFSIKKK